MPEVNPNDVAANVNPEPTTNAPVSNTLTPPAAPPVSAPAPVMQPSVTPAVPPSPNRGLHSFINSFLSSTVGALAGKAPTKYITDTEGRVVPAPVQPTDSLGDKGRRLAAHALEGLAAGSQVPQQKSGGASALAGLGAGAQAVTANAKATDAKARQEERENEEAKQQKMLRMHEIARGNALTASTWQHMMESEQDRDPARAQHLDWAKAAEAAGVAVKYVSEDEANQIRQSDPQASAKYQILPVGMKIVQDSQGQPVLDENGKPKMTGQFALIDGLHDGNIPAPATFISDLQKYGKFAGLSAEETAGLKAGDDLSMQHFIKLANSIQEGKKKELMGWEKSELGWDGPDKTIPVQINSADPTQKRSFAPGVVPNAENKPADAETKRKLQESQSDLDDAKKQEALANAALLSQGLNTGGDANTLLPQYAEAIKNLPEPAQKLLRAVSPMFQMTILKVAAGDEDVQDATKNPRKGVPAMTVTQLGNLASLANPKWTGQLFKAKQKLVNDFTSGPASQQINSMNQFLGHAGQAADIISRFRTTQSPYLNKSINWLRANAGGDKDVYALLQALEPVRDEYLNMIKSGKAATADEIERMHKTLNEDMPISALMGNLSVAGEQGVTRIDQLNEQWKQVTGTGAPNLVRETGRDGARKLGISKAVEKYNTGGMYSGANASSSPESGQPQQAPNIDMTKVVAGVDKTKLHSDGKLVIGWNPTVKAWVDAYTGQPYQQTPPTGAQ